MWADAQRDGRPAEYRWRPLQKFRNSTPQSLAHPAAGVPCSNAATIWENENARLARKVNWQNSVRRKQPMKMNV